MRRSLLLPDENGSTGSIPEDIIDALHSDEPLSHK